MKTDLYLHIILINSINIMSSETKKVDLFTEEKNRDALFPIIHPKVFEFYKKLNAIHWITNEIDMSGDRAMFNDKCTKGDKRAIKYVLGFFAIGDEVVLKNLDNILALIKIKEFQYVYRHIQLQECIHSEGYSIQIDTILSGEEKEETFEATKNMPIIKEMKEWIDKWSSDDIPFEVRILLLCVVESVLFSDKFAIIQSFKERNLLHGLVHYNEYISRDENLHVDMAIFMITEGYVNKPSEEIAHKLFRQAIMLSHKFVDNAIALGDPPEGLSISSLKNYINFNADVRIEQLGYKRLFNIDQNPLPFMIKHALGKVEKQDFFVRSATQYQQLQPGALVYSIDNSPIDLK